MRSKGLPGHSIGAQTARVMDRPVQVMLDPEQRRRARRRAAVQGLTLSEYITRLIADDLEGWTPDAGAPAVSRTTDSRATDVPPHHGMHIGEAVAARMNKTDRPR